MIKLNFHKIDKSESVVTMLLTFDLSVSNLFKIFLNILMDDQLVKISTWMVGYWDIVSSCHMH